MDPGSIWQLFVLFILLCCSSFFSASETALMSLSKIRVRHMVEEDIKGSALIEKLVEHPGKLLGTILVGNNVVNIAASALATSLALEFFEKKGIGIATAVMTVLVLIFGEITPKSLAAQNSEKVSLKVVKPIALIVSLLNPIVIVFTYLTNGLIKLFGGSVDNTQPFITEEELRTIVTVSQEEGVLEVEEKQMIYNVFEFGDLQVKDVMIQRTDIVAINLETDYELVVDIMKYEQFSRYPVYRERIDEIIGILNVKDLVFLSDTKESFQIEKYIRKPFYTFEFKKITEVFTDMKKNRVHMAIVLDEYGGTAGIVTIEDLIEEIVGDIQDEYDDYENDIQVIREDEFLINGSTKIDLVNEMIGTNLESEDFDSLGGFIIGELGRLPLQGEKIEYNNIRFIVEKIDKNRIRNVRVLT
ncbi:MAG: hemolysin family protein [Thermotaleaceae bacterium]